MMRIAGIVCLAVTTIAAAPPRSDFSEYAVLDQSTVHGGPGSTFSGPAAGATAPGAGIFAPAPVPDTDLLAPRTRAVNPSEPEVQANLFTNQKGYHGEGYLFGSTVQTSQDRRSRPAPGFSLKVPLE